MSDIDIHEVLRYLPHRYPFLLVDRVIESGPESLTAIKNVEQGLKIKGVVRPFSQAAGNAGGADH